MILVANALDRVAGVADCGSSTKTDGMTGGAPVRTFACVVDDFLWPELLRGSDARGTSGRERLCRSQVVGTARARRQVLWQRWRSVSRATHLSSSGPAHPPSRND